MSVAPNRIVTTLLFARCRCLAVFALLAGPWCASAQDSGIGYPTVAKALEALKARDDVQISMQGGWTIVDDRARNAIWSFAPPDHPAYPAVVKRTLVSKDGGIFIEMSELCQASKVACDKLLADFKELNEKMIASIRTRTPTSPESEIQVERIGNDEFRLALKSYRSATVEAGQRELAEKAKDVCGGRSVTYGKYTFEAKQQLGSTSQSATPTLLLAQEVGCGKVPDQQPAAISSGEGDPNFRPTDAEEKAVEQRTYAYFSAKDAGRYEEAYSLFSSTQKRVIPLEQFTSQSKSFNKTAGEVRSRTIKKITWYRNPPDVDPGVYAAVDFKSQFANIDIHCGYVAWKEQSDGSFLLVREEQNFIDKGGEQKLQATEIARLRARFNCD